jgi:hypothetical protein
MLERREPMEALAEALGSHVRRPGSSRDRTAGFEGSKQSSVERLHLPVSSSACRFNQVQRMRLRHCGPST